MSYKLALVFLVGLVAFAGAVPVDNPEQDAELKAVVADTEKEVPLNQESVPEEKSEDDQEEFEGDLSEDENQEPENDEDEEVDESDSEEEEEPENELDEAKRGAAGNGNRPRRRPRYCGPNRRYSARCLRLLRITRRVCSRSAVQCFNFGRPNRGTWGRICKSVRRRENRVNRVRRIRLCHNYGRRFRSCGLRNRANCHRLCNPRSIRNLRNLRNRRRRNLFCRRNCRRCRRG